MRLAHLLLLLFAIAVWGFNFVVIKTGLRDIPPIFLCFARFFFCLPVLFFIKPPPVPMKKIVIYSLVTFVLQFSLLFIAMRSGITPGLASVLLQFQSFFAIGLGVFFMKEKYHLWQGTGAAVALLGILLVAAHIGGEITVSGFLLVLSAAVMWAIGSFLAKKMEKGSGLPLVAWGSLVACLPLLLLSLLIEGQEAIRECLHHLTWLNIGIVSYIAYLATLLGFSIWNWLLQYYPLSKLAPFTLLVPPIGMLSSSLFLGEELQWWKIAAAGLIIGGVGMNVLAARIPKDALLKPLD